MRPFSFFISAILGLGMLFGQGPTLTGIGSADPTMMRVAPGQITTLFVSGLKTVLASQVSASTLPLPATLAGISVTLNQPGSQPIPVPLVSIRQISVCAAVTTPPSPDCLISAITIQIPFELTLLATGDFSSTASTTLAVSENGATGKTFGILPVSDILHVMTLCDVYPSPKFIRTSQPVGTPIPTCAPLATHAAGDLITADDPATPGEDIVIWAFGLGATVPTPKTGQASPTPAATLSSSLFLQFDFRVNAAPSRPYINPLIMATLAIPLPAFAGLTPGQVGLYQINVAIPASIPAIGACTTGSPGLSVYNAVQSNLTIDLGAPVSFDGAAICVKSN